MSRFARIRAGADPEAGLTLVELLVAAAISVVLVGAACTMLISAVRSQPTLSKKSQEISTARYVLERMTREIRNGISVVPSTAAGSHVEFRTRVRRSTCGGAVQESPSVPAIECRVTYNCTTTECTRTETAPEVSGTAGTPIPIIDNLVSDKVFNPEPSTAPTYIGITLHIANPEGKGELTITDGAGLRIQNYFDEVN
ncbi:MAG TPA: prepilin-type N-terminal cleavage/methylation domain-containing protein [Solirubrobacterales bacterium]|nr:prepilin-type N-terminal cleavage/methylation domain-containing protein [Solirubrobacterales bacterium]